MEILKEKFPSTGIIIVFATDIRAGKRKKRKACLPQRSSNITKQLWNNLLQIRDQTIFSPNNSPTQKQSKSLPTELSCFTTPLCATRQNKNAALYFKDFITLQE